MPLPIITLLQNVKHKGTKHKTYQVTNSFMTGIIHLLKKQLNNWYYKQQHVQGFSADSSKSLLAPITLRPIFKLDNMLKGLFIRIDDPDNLFVYQIMTPSTILQTSNHKKHHNAQDYHRICEAKSTGIFHFRHSDGKFTTSNILTKIIAQSKLCSLIQPLLYWKDETIQDNHPNLLIMQFIKAINLAAFSGLRGVSDIYHVSPSDASMGRSEVAFPASSSRNAPFPEYSQKEVVQNSHDSMSAKRVIRWDIDDCSTVSNPSCVHTSDGLDSTIQIGNDPYVQIRRQGASYTDGYSGTETTVDIHTTVPKPTQVYKDPGLSVQTYSALP
jgi:hypothetical protein